MRRSGGKRRELTGLSRLGIVLELCKRGLECLTAFLCRCGNENEQISSCKFAGEDVDEEIEVKSSIVENELRARELTVLSSWQKMRNRLRKRSFEQSRWLWIDRVLLNRFRWSGAFLCATGGHWGIYEYSSRANAEILEKFFSGEMKGVRNILQCVYWSIGVENENS